MVHLLYVRIANPFLHHHRSSLDTHTVCPLCNCKIGSLRICRTYVPVLVEAILHVGRLQVLPLLRVVNEIQESFVLYQL